MTKQGDPETTRATEVMVLEPWSVTDVAAAWRSLVVLGLLTMALGFLAILVPHLASIAAELLVGVLLLVIGLLEGVHAVQMRGRRGQMWRVLGAVLGVGLGLLLLFFPIAGVVSLTLVVAVFLVVEGILKSGMALQLKPLNGWGWLLTSGVLALLLGIVIIALWPSAALWVLGLLLGIDLVFSGLWLVFLALAGRRWARQGA